MKLEHVLRGVSVKECSPNDGEYTIEFKMKVYGVDVTFQSHPLDEMTAISGAKSIMDWAREYSIIRKKLSVFIKALNTISTAARSVEDELKGVVQ